MKKLVIKTVIMLCTFGAAGTILCHAQDLTLSSVPDPEVLVSPVSSNNVAQPPIIQEAQDNLETSLVNIKAVDDPTFHTLGDKTGFGEEVREGQGIIIDPNGTIATNRHIIGHPAHIYVMLSDGKTFEATLLKEAQSDLCFIKIDVTYPLKAISLADPSEIQIGNKVTALGNAAFHHPRIQAGQIIRVFKSISSNNIEFLEMNIPLNPGDSGGAVLNRDGSLMGLIMGKQISDPSKSYAIASNLIQQEYFKYRDSILN